MRENKLTLSDFPLKLRKLALFIAQNDTGVSLKEACRKMELNYDSICVQITKQRKKGKDFNDLLNQQAFEYLRSRVREVDENLVEQAISPSQTNPKFLELYYKRIGLLKDSPLMQIDNRAITVVCVPPAAIPSDLKDNYPNQ